MDQKEKFLESILFPILCLGLGIFLLALSPFLVTRDHVAQAIQFFHPGGLSVHLPTQIVYCIRYFLILTGLSLGVSALLWKPFFSKVLEADRFTEKGDKEICGWLFVATLMGYLLVEWFVFQKFPLSADEFSYLYQAKIFASGGLTVSAHPLQGFFTSAFIALNDGRLFSIMPPGWPLVLAPWTWIHLAWCVNPLLSALSGVLLFLLGKEMFNRTIGLLAAVLMAVSPFFIYMSE